MRELKELANTAFDINETAKVNKNNTFNYRVETFKERIKRLVSKEFRIDVEDITQRTRKGNIKTARQVSMYFHNLNKNKLRTTLQEIGQEHGNFDHATVNHARIKVDEWCYSDKHFRAKIEGLKSKINNYTI